MRNIRDYGLGDFTKYVIGRLREVERLDLPCPHCHLDHGYMIQVVLHHMPGFRTEYAQGAYLGCPACPWASPCVVEPIERLPEWFVPLEDRKEKP